MEEIGKQQRRIGKLERKWKCMDLDEWVTFRRGGKCAEHHERRISPPLLPSELTWLTHSQSSQTFLWIQQL
jgi:hypothetical protein